MKLSQKAIEATKQNRGAVLELALALGFTELWINKLLDQNKENGKLTTATAIKAIHEKTGLSESEILVSDEVVAAAL